MLSLKFLFRYVLVCLLVLMPLLSIGWVFFGMSGALSAVCIGCVVLLVGTVFLEVLMIYCFPVIKEETKGLNRSFQLAGIDFKGLLPRLVVFLDPLPDVLFIKSLWGRGTILLSQGLVGLLNEEELQMTLKLSLIKVTARGSFFRSFCSLLVILVLYFSPKAWVQLVFSKKLLTKKEQSRLNPLSTFWFLLLFPWIRFFLVLGKFGEQRKDDLEFNTVFLRATQKVAQATLQAKSQGKSQTISQAISMLSIKQTQKLFSLFSSSA